MARYDYNTQNFENGVFPLGKVEPSVSEHSLKFERKYYKVAEGRAAITEDKVSDENARLLTMVAIASRTGNMKGDYMAVDIGSKTTDIVYLVNGIPVESKSITIERAMVKWIRQIQGSLQVQYGKNIPENEILKVILKQNTSLPRSYSLHIQKWHYGANFSLITGTGRKRI